VSSDGRFNHGSIITFCDRKNAASPDRTARAARDRSSRAARNRTARTACDRTARAARDRAERAARDRTACDRSALSRSSVRNIVQAVAAERTL